MSRLRGVCALTLASLALYGAAAWGRGGGGMVFTYYTIPGKRPGLDNVCVTPELTVGAKSKNINGDVMEVTELLGKSAMCRAKDKPILAKVQLTPSADFTSTLKIGLPKDFVELPLTDKDRFDGKRFVANNRHRDITVYVSSWNRAGAVNFNTWIRQVRQNQIDGNDRTSSTVEELDFDGIEARRWVLMGGPAKGMFAKKKAWVETYIKGDKELVWVEVAINADDLDKHRDEIYAISESVSGLKAEPTGAAEPAP